MTPETAQRAESASAGDTAGGRFSFYIENFGCQMNVSDNSEIKRELRKQGGNEAEVAEHADLVLVNTCVVRHTAEDRELSYIGRLKDLKDGGDDPFLGVMGCLVPKEKQTLPRRFPFVDSFILRSNPGMVMEELEPFFNRLPERDNGAQPGYDPRPEFDEVATPHEVGHSNAFVTVQRGCDKYCTFCIVPYVKGRETSVPPGDVLSQARAGVEAGYPMVTLLGQSIMTYGRDSEDLPNFAGLMKLVSRVEGLTWLNFLTSHPADLTNEIIYEVLTLPNLVSYLHLPIQAGSNRILERMNRRYTVEEYLEKIEKIREVRPDIFLSTDVIVGFPGETEEEYEQTLELMREVEFNDAYMFKYSPRKYTKAYKDFAEDELPEEEKHGRLVNLIEMQKDISKRANRRYVGRRERVIVDEVDEEETLGLTRWTKKVHLPPSGHSPGDWVDVDLTGVRVSTFEGEFVS